MHYSNSFKRNSILYLFVFTAIVFLDQLTKQLLIHKIGLNNSREFIPGIVSLTVVQNTGGAFSILNQYPIYFKIIGIVNALLFSYFTFCPTVHFNILTKVGCACILGGTIGNLLDRFILNGVIDFVDLQVINFAVFNLADIFIDCGVVLVIAGWCISKGKNSQ